MVLGIHVMLFYVLLYSCREKVPLVFRFSRVSCIMYDVCCMLCYDMVWYYIALCYMIRRQNGEPIDYMAQVWQSAIPPRSWRPMPCTLHSQEIYWNKHWATTGQLSPSLWYNQRLSTLKTAVLSSLRRSHELFCRTHIDVALRRITRNM